MNEHASIPVIGYTIAEGNPAEGFTMYGFFATKAQAIEASENDPTISTDWWLMPIYQSTANTGA